MSLDTAPSGPQTARASSTSAQMTPSRPTARVILPVVLQHAEEAAMLRHVRSVLVRAPHVRLLQLGRLDERIAAHLDGLMVAGDQGAAIARAQLERAGTGEVFACAALALACGDSQLLGGLAELAGASPDARRGLVSALGWAEPKQLRGVVATWLASSNARLRTLGLETCRLQRVNPGAPLTTALDAPDPAERMAALRLVGELGLTDCLPAAREAAAAGDGSALGLTALRQCCLLGEGQRAAAALWSSDDFGWALAVQAVALPEARAWVKALRAGAATGRSAQRRMIQACGVLGDSAVVPWLIERMADLRDARLAGEAFSLITGADLSALDLEQKPPQPERDGRVAGGAGPSEQADDDDVMLDEDESLPWPDAARVHAWWHKHRTELPAGQRLFLGAPVTFETASRVLLEGNQRQRALAAQWLCLLRPGHALFPVAAPTPRQRRQLSGRAAAV